MRVLSFVVVVCGVALAGCPPEPPASAAVCLSMVECFFAEGRDTLPERTYLHSSERASDIRAAYGLSGTCWRADDKVQEQCVKDCICMFREACQEPEVREELCRSDKFKDDGKCCTNPQVREAEGKLPDPDSGAEGRDPVCDLPLSSRIPDEFCPTDGQ